MKLTSSSKTKKIISLVPKCLSNGLTSSLPIGKVSLTENEYTGKQKKGGRDRIQ